jgi:RND family efflux transporter MFP subunit
MNTIDRKVSAVPEPSLAAAPVETPVMATNSPPPKLGRWVIVTLLLVIVLLIIGVVPRVMKRAALTKETKELAIMSVQVTNAVPGKPTSSLALPAELRPYQEAPIYARASGFVKKWYVDIGASVKAGDPLADIDTPDLDQQVTQAKAELEQANAASALAGITAKRWAELMKTQSVSEQEDAEKQADLKLKVAAVDSAKANLGRLQEMQGFTHVTAPFTGTLTARDIDVGDLISPGKELFRLADTSKLRVFVRVPQTATPGIADGVGATMTVPELPARKFAAKVVRTSGAIDANSRTLLTELEVDNSKGELLAGSYAEVSFADLKANAPLVLPATTILFRDGMQVGVVEPDGTVKLHDIKVGRDFGKTLEVVSGITAADRVIINPADSLVSGTAVRIVSSSDMTDMSDKAEKAK